MTDGGTISPSMRWSGFIYDGDMLHRIDPVQNMAGYYRLRRHTTSIQIPTRSIR
jgi:hypothetical protein